MDDDDSTELNRPGTGRRRLHGARSTSNCTSIIIIGPNLLLGFAPNLGADRPSLGIGDDRRDLPVEQVCPFRGVLVEAGDIVGFNDYPSLLGARRMPAANHFVSLGKGCAGREEFANALLDVARGPLEFPMHAEQHN